MGSQRAFSNSQLRVKLGSSQTPACFLKMCTSKYSVPLAKLFTGRKFQVKIYVCKSPASESLIVVYLFSYL